MNIEGTFEVHFTGMRRDKNGIERSQGSYRSACLVYAVKMGSKQIQSTWAERSEYILIDARKDHEKASPQG